MHFFAIPLLREELDGEIQYTVARMRWRGAKMERNSDCFIDTDGEFSVCWEGSGYSACVPFAVVNTLVTF